MTKIFSAKALVLSSALAACLAVPAIGGTDAPNQAHQPVCNKRLNKTAKTGALFFKSIVSFACYCL